MDEDRLARIEEKLDRLLAVLDRFAPFLDRFTSGRLTPTFRRQGGDKSSAKG